MYFESGPHIALLNYSFSSQAIICRMSAEQSPRSHQHAALNIACGTILINYQDVIIYIMKGSRDISVLIHNNLYRIQHHYYGAIEWKQYVRLLRTRRRCHSISRYTHIYHRAHRYAHTHRPIYKCANVQIYVCMWLSMCVHVLKCMCVLCDTCI